MDGERSLNCNGGLGEKRRLASRSLYRYRLLPLPLDNTGGRTTFLSFQSLLSPLSSCHLFSFRSSITFFFSTDVSMFILFYLFPLTLIQILLVLLLKKILSYAVCSISTFQVSLYTVQYFHLFWSSPTCFQFLHTRFYLILAPGEKYEDRG